jgi:hypothetical protein
MTEAAAKQQLLNDIEKLDQHKDHNLINILRCCIDPRHAIRNERASHRRPSSTALPSPEVQRASS